MYPVWSAELIIAWKSPFFKAGRYVGTRNGTDVLRSRAGTIFENTWSEGEICAEAVRHATTEQIRKLRADFMFDRITVETNDFIQNPD